VAAVVAGGSVLPSRDDQNHRQSWVQNRVQ
jgi:hypothetical protein